MTTYSSRAVAPNGAPIVNDGTEFLFNGYGIFFPEDSVVLSIKVNGEGTNQVAEYITTPSNPVAAGSTLMVIPAKGHDYFSAITLDSGSCQPLLNE